MSKEKGIKKLQEMEKNKFKITGKKFQEKTWFDALLQDSEVETRINEFFLLNSRDFFEKGAKAKEVVRLTINGKPAVEIKYSVPGDKEVYSVFFGEFCHYTPTRTGEFQPNYTFINNGSIQDGKGFYHLSRRFNFLLKISNDDIKINGLDYDESTRVFNTSTIEKLKRKEEKKQARNALIQSLKALKQVK